MLFCSRTVAYLNVIPSLLIICSVWIYKLGPEGKDPFGNPQYEYAIVSNWVKYPVTVLVRDPDTFKKKHEPEVLRWLEDQVMENPE